MLKKNKQRSARLLLSSSFQTHRFTNDQTKSNERILLEKKFTIIKIMRKLLWAGLMAMLLPIEKCQRKRKCSSTENEKVDYRSKNI